MKSIFTDIVENGRWGTTICGPGSTLEYTAHIRAALPILIEKHNIKSMFDAPCGDFSWMSTVPFAKDFTYIGGDIVDSLISNNKEKYPLVNFINFDLTKDKMSTVDLFFCRDCLFHLSFKNIDRVLQNFIDSGSKYILVSNHYEKNSTNDITEGKSRYINFLHAPYNFPEPIDSIQDWNSPDPKRYMLMWDRETIINYFEIKKNMTKIPKIIHIIWVGDEDKRPDSYIQTWSVLNPDWEVRLWGNYDYNNYPWKNKKAMESLWDDDKFEVSRKSAIADIMRYEILYNHGGFCVDADAECVTKLEDWLFDAEACAGWENEEARPGLIAVGYMASIPGNEFFKSIVDEIYNDPDITDGPPWIKTGPTRLTNAYNSFNYTGLKIWPSYYFIPNHYGAPPYNGTDTVFAIQHWSTTRDILANEELKRNPPIPKAKTCIYTIALNEIKHVDRFMEHCAGADLVLVCDTGSTDGTAERLRELGATVYNIMQTPWRFDVARNIALSLVPLDIDLCISVDLDECLQPGWSELIELHWQDQRGQISRIKYDYIWNWQPEGITPEGRFHISKIHSRKGFQWKFPCHEVLYNASGEPEFPIVNIPEIQLHHRSDPDKSRGSYLQLLELGVKEDPHSDRMRHYYGRELMYRGRHSEAIKELEHHVNMPEAWWDEERAASLRYISSCYRNLGNTSKSIEYGMKAVLEWNASRETWMELADAAYAGSDWHTCYWAATKALALTTITTSYRTEARNWGYRPHDHAALSAYHLGLFTDAVKHGREAVRLCPGDSRLISNLQFYVDGLNRQLELV